MRWMWVDRIVSIEPGVRLVAVKAVSLSEEHLHDHFAAEPAGPDGPVRPATPIMPASLIIEGMAQSAGILVGHSGEFREKVLLAKVARVELEQDALPGDTLRYTATILSIGPQGASTGGQVELRRAAAAAFETVGRIDLVFSHADQAMDLGAGGVPMPRENFVFGEGFRTLLRMSGID